MAGKKVSLAYIANDSKRKATFNERKKGLVKEVNELSVLCGIEACAVIYDPFSSNADLWPSQSGVKNVVERFDMLPKFEHKKKMVNHEKFINESIKKITERNGKQVMDNKERRMKELMFSFLRREVNVSTLSVTDGEDLCEYIDQYLKELNHHQNKNGIPNHPLLEYGEPSSPVANGMAPPTVITEVGSSSTFPCPNVVNPSVQ